MPNFIGSMRKYSLFLFLLVSIQSVFCQQHAVSFTSSDTALQAAFNWAKQQALHYKGKPGDPVGPWYESALPPRYAFCMRDVSHQSIGGEILGLGKENKNMFTLFAKHISQSKDWCSYWEMNRTGEPAPEDYRNDTAFWYNLNANFDLLHACWRLYLWTGDKSYIQSPAFANFHQKSVDAYIRSWVLQEDSLFNRPAHPNASVSFNEEDAFHRCRGLPSYSEGVPNLKTGIDLVAAIYRGLRSYASILELEGKTKEAAGYIERANAYQQHIDKYWWNDSASLYNTYYSNEGKFGLNEGETFLLWFDALKDSVRKSKTIEHLYSNDWNVENLSYHSLIYYKNGYWEKAYQNILHLANPSTARREYPEVSFGVVEGIVQGLMGIDADASAHRISTLFRTKDETNATVQHVPVLNTTISVKHTNNKTSELTNEGKTTLSWRASFAGVFKQILVNGKSVKAQRLKDESGLTISFADIQVNAGKSVTAAAK